jgi:probable HAF family extracellular repeat protein
MCKPGGLMKICSILVLPLALAASAASAGPYVVSNLGATPSGAHALMANAINAYGQVVGQSDALSNSAFLWQPTTANGTTGSLIDLGPSSPISATGINDFGQIVACTRCVPTQLGPWSSSLWTPASPNSPSGTWTTLSAPSLNGILFAALGINSSGQVVGTDPVATGSQIALWSPTAPNSSSGMAVNLGDLPGVPENGTGWGINAYGQLLGNGNIVGSSTRAFLWSPTTPNGTSGSMVELVNVDSFGGAINDAGQVALTKNGVANLFLWNPTVPNGPTGTVSDLGKLPGATQTGPRSMNASGSIVGVSIGAENRAFLWEPGVPNGNSGTLIDLNTLLSTTDAVHWKLSSANGINSLGQIVGYGLYDADGPGGAAAVTQGFLLTPIPEPSTIALTLLAFAALPTHRRKSVSHTRV